MNISKWVKSCLHKKRLSEEICDLIIKKADKPLRKYYCNYCFGWHLTSKNVIDNKQQNKPIIIKPLKLNKRVLTWWNNLTYDEKLIEINIGGLNKTPNDLTKSEIQTMFNNKQKPHLNQF